MSDFHYGPFSFEPFQRLRLAGQDSQQWRMSYGREELGITPLPFKATRTEIVEAFSDKRADFIVSSQIGPPEKYEPLEKGYEVALVRSSSTVGVSGRYEDFFTALAPIPGLSAGLIDDRYDTWLVATDLGMNLPMTRAEFERLKSAHEVIKEALLAAPPPKRPPAYAWVTTLLPDAVTTDKIEHWRAPTAWEIRHVVGEGSFTGVTGAKAAELIGMAPQNFRKYLASDSAKNRQNISFSAWHLLLQRLDVKDLAC